MEPLTKEAILSLSNGTITFEQARALFNVDLSTFKARLEQLNIFVWKEYGTLVRIHGGDYKINVVIKDVRTYDASYYYTVSSTFAFANVIRMIEKDLKLSPGCYKLTVKHPNKSFGNVWVKTDRDWHFLVLFSRFRGYFVYLDLEVFPSSQTADEDACDEGPWESTWYDEPSDFDFSDEGASDEDVEEAYVKNVFVEDACDENSMELLTKEAILSLNNGSMTFEQARAFFNVDVLTFKAMLEKLNIFVWKECDGRLVRIHGGDYGMTIVIKDVQKYHAVQAKNYYTVESTDAFEDVIRMIEEDLKLSPGCYKLTFKHPNKSYGNVIIKTDRDWHFLVLFSSVSGYFVYLDLEVFPSNQTAGEDACDEPIMMLK